MAAKDPSEAAKADAAARALEAGGSLPDPKRKGASIPEIELDVARTREEFAATLDALEDRLNPKLQFARAKATIQTRLDQDPAPLIAAAAAGLVGTIALIVGIAVIASHHKR